MGQNMTRQEAIDKAAQAVLIAQQTYPQYGGEQAKLVDMLIALGVLKIDAPMIDHWIKPGAFVPVNENTVSLLIQEVIRLRAISSPQGTKS